MVHIIPLKQHYPYTINCKVRAYWFINKLAEERDWVLTKNPGT